MIEFDIDIGERVIDLLSGKQVVITGQRYTIDGMAYWIEDSNGTEGVRQRTEIEKL